MDMLCRCNRRWSAIASVVAMMVLAAGCASTQPAATNTTTPPRAALPAPPSCNAGPAQFVLGQAPSPQLMESARAAANAGMVRVIRSDQPFGSQQRADRLNLQLDRHYRITSARCG